MRPSLSVSYAATLVLVCWSINTANAQTFDSLQIITPGIAPSVVSHRQVEVAFFNQLSTEKSVFEFDTLSETSRFSALYNVLQVGYGISKKNRLNVGGIFVFANTRFDADEDRSPFAVFGSGDSSAIVFHKPAAIGGYVRGIPFRRLPELTVQAGLLFPATGDKVARQFSGYDRVVAQLQVSFYQQLSPLFYLFAAAQTSVLFANDTRKQTSVLLPFNLYPVFQLGRGSKAYLYGNLSYTAQFNKVSPGFLRNSGQRVMYGIGGQYYFSPAFSVYAQMQFPAVIDLESTTTTILKEGAFVLALGGRWVF
jgi:hypothetical protein